MKNSKIKCMKLFTAFSLFFISTCSIDASIIPQTYNTGALKSPAPQTSITPVVSATPSASSSANQSPSPSLSSPVASVSPSGNPSVAPSVIPSASPKSTKSTYATPPTSGKSKENYLKIKNVPFTGKFQFVFLGDNRNSSPFSTDGNEIYESLISKINKLKAKPLFVVNGGDFTYDSLGTHWRKFEEMNSKLLVPLLTIPGNHDILLGRSYYETNYMPKNPDTGFFDYSFDYGNTRFICLDDASAEIADKQIGWLTNQLKTDMAHKIVMAHVPPSYKNWESHGLDDEDKGLTDKEISKKFMDICEGNKVELVLLSHIHLFDNSVVRNGVQYIVSGGAGGPLKESGFGNPIFHYVMITIGDTVKYELVAL